MGDFCVSLGWAEPRGHRGGGFHPGLAELGKSGSVSSMVPSVPLFNPANQQVCAGESLATPASPRIHPWGG